MNGVADDIGGALLAFRATGHLSLERFYMLNVSALKFIMGL